MDVADEMERILEQEPELGDFGFGVFYPQAKTLEERESGLRKEREYIREPRSLESLWRLVLGLRSLAGERRLTGVLRVMASNTWQSEISVM